MTNDAWQEATFAGASEAGMRRVSRLTPQQRLDWLEAALRDADRAGIVAKVRRRRHQLALAAWTTTESG